MSVLSLFPEPRADEHPVALAALEAGAVLSVSVSGGKDSQAMHRRLGAWRAVSDWNGSAEAVHADLGRAEWSQTPAHVEAMTAGWPLVVVQREKGDLVQRIEERLNTVSTIPGETRPAKPFWPSAQQRYCTSDLKRGPIQKHLRTHGPTALVVSAMGMRAAESPGRARRPVVEMDRKVSAKAYADALDAGATLASVVASHIAAPAGRLVLSWLPIHDWTDADVWGALGTGTADLARRRALYAAGDEAGALAGWQAHPAYVMGNERLSCALCVLASRSDLVNGARHNPALLATYIELEQRSGYTFRDGLSLSDIAAEAAQPTPRRLAA